MKNFVDLLNNIKGTTFVSIDTVTNVPLKGGKTNPMKDRVQKRCKGHNVILYANCKVNGYAAMVRRRLVAEGKDPQDFQLSPRAWGERLKGYPLVIHMKDGVLKFYFEVIFIKPGVTEYLLDGTPIAKEAIIGLNESEEGEQGGLENKVIIRTYALDSIERIRIDHTEYEGPWEINL